MPFRWLLILLLLATAGLYLLRLGDRGVISEEVRWAEVAREMDQSGDLFWPTINGRLYYDKPLGSYWLVLAASKLTGEVNEMAARLPAAIAGVIGVLVLFLLARKLYDDKTAFYAGMILATSFGYAFYSRRASADIETLTGVLIAFAIYAFNPNQPTGLRILLLWLVMALTSQTKGLLGFALPILMLLVDGLMLGLRSTLSRGWRKYLSFRNLNPWLWNYWTILALPLGVVLFLLPYAISAWKHPESDGLAMVFRENLQRFIAPHNHLGPVYLYVGVIFVIFAPWSLFLIPGLIQLHANRSKNESDRLVKVYFWTTFLFFTLSASRRSYYLLPILPAAALLVARLLVEATTETSRCIRFLKEAGFGLFAVVVLLACLALLPAKTFLGPPLDQLPALPAQSLFVAGWLLSLLAILLMYRWGWHFWRVPALAIITFMGLSYLFHVQEPASQELRGRKVFVADVHGLLSDDFSRLAFFSSRELAFDLKIEKPLPDADTPDELKAMLAAKKPRWLIAPHKLLHQVEAPYRIVLEEKDQPWENQTQKGLKYALLELQ